MKTYKTLYELQADVCKTLASPKRLEILSVLKDGEKSVGELVDILGVPKANVSQHLSVMRYKGILHSRREGVNIYYSIANVKVIKACMLMKEVLTEQLKEKNQLLELVINGKK
ncbi:putative HTH-type transcriptional regulator/MT0088 [bacterium BMS3Abin07]|nr:putative HTH-type transcriptional regulator/MT0088 [bacterium BMS3Abin07]GBE32785.1 putative HTH-type transcriptional regulator/MT0088 [bacterium BMS3Bbin05]HDL20496.1 ArsR family transcriptional regulator [Nitrospirota bacterium]HDO22937.1 ArsR family transcriptional regulator [Nitrospirota bacterium]